MLMTFKETEPTVLNYDGVPPQSAPAEPMAMAAPTNSAQIGLG
jgi:hypothetical protein